MMRSLRLSFLIFAAAFGTTSAQATDAKLDADTCAQLRLEQIKFRQSGILNDINKGPEWAKANLTSDRLREVEHYMLLDEQVQFGCRDAKLSPEAEKASEAAARIEINSDADPTIPPPPVTVSPAAGVTDPPKPGAPAASKKPAKKAVQKKPKPADPKVQGLEKAKKPARSSVSEDVPPPPIPMQTEEAAAPEPPSPPATVPVQASSPAPTVGAAPVTSDPPLPAFGFGEMTVVPHSSP